jgi:hypothetical protein
MKLNVEKLSALAAIYDSAGLQVVFDIMENFCIEAENEFIATKPSDQAGVLANHAILHAQRKYFQDVAEKIDSIVSEYRSTDKKNTASKRATSIK